MTYPHIKDSNAGQETPGKLDLYYLAYVHSHGYNNQGKDLLTKEQWLVQYNMLHCQLLGEG